MQPLAGLRVAAGLDRVLTDARKEGEVGLSRVAPAVVGIAMVGIEHRRNVKLREARKQRIKDRTTGVEHLRRGSSGLTEVKVEEEATEKVVPIGGEDA